MYLNSALLIIGAMVVGYTFASRLLWLRYRLRLTQGYHTFFFTAAWSVPPLLLSVVLVPLSNLSDHADEALLGVFARAGITLKDNAGGALTLLLAALAVAALLPELLHLLARWATGMDIATLKLAAMYSAEPAPELSNVQFDSFQYGLPIALTLSDRKVYIGYPAFISTSLYSAHGSDLFLTPLVSGYRDPKTLALQLSTPYEDVLNELKSPGDGDPSTEAFVITIPIREVVHAHLYDPTLQPVFDKHAKNFTQAGQTGGTARRPDNNSVGS